MLGRFPNRLLDPCRRKGRTPVHDDEGQEGHAAGDADQAESQRTAGCGSAKIRFAASPSPQSRSTPSRVELTPARTRSQQDRARRSRDAPTRADQRRHPIDRPQRPEHPERDARIGSFPAVNLHLRADGEEHGSAVDSANGGASDLPTLPYRRRGDDVEMRAERRDLNLNRRCATRLAAVAQRTPPIDEAHKRGRASQTVDGFELPLLEALASPVEREPVEARRAVYVRS